MKTILLIIIGILSTFSLINYHLSYADELQPLPSDFRDLTEHEIDISPLYDVEDVYPIPSAPLKQLSAGVSINNIQCKPNLHLIIKYNDAPACVKSKTAQKLTDTQSWSPSEKLWKKLEKQIYSITDESFCPKRCINIESVETMQQANENTSLRINLPSYIPKNYEFFKYYPNENALNIQISSNPLTENTTWGDFYLMDHGILLTYIDYPVTSDGRTQTAYWAKTQDAQNISQQGNEPIFVKERNVTFDEDLGILFLGSPSEAQFNLNDDISIIITGYVPQEEIIKIAHSFFGIDK
ncbi:MAG: hypothetical protein K5798_02910 [Nitrosopumilus sp.]|uniref:hypothetical protein n=1 Tax=Nitrosopumilus sp. TaxID=2024843 RepID=UPI0024311810|nr:hypothetical protein [Nitrosopumilus sp.]MCV0366201.1 hypothetical protein [Nitrosopumilus sp.]